MFKFLGSPYQAIADNVPISSGVPVTGVTSSGGVPVTVHLTIGVPNFGDNFGDTILYRGQRDFILCNIAQISDLSKSPKRAN
jgi:hypothetical protein